MSKQKTPIDIARLHIARNITEADVQALRELLPSAEVVAKLCELADLGVKGQAIRAAAMAIRFTNDPEAMGAFINGRTAQSQEASQ